MAKQRRRATPPTKKKATARKGTSPRTARSAAKKPGRSATRRSASRRVGGSAAKPKALAVKAAPAAQSPQPAAPPAPAPPRKPGFYEAVAIYERGVQALQRHDFGGAAQLFRTVIEKYPEERELLERARLYLRVCERETARRAEPPQSSSDHVYAATVALNSGDHASAVSHLQRALNADDENDHAHYIMAATLTLRGRHDEALTHLQRSIALNPENRVQARQDPDLDVLRRHERFQATLATPPVPRRRPARQN